MINHSGICEKHLRGKRFGDYRYALIQMNISVSETKKKEGKEMKHGYYVNTKYQLRLYYYFLHHYCHHLTHPQNHQNYLHLYDYFRLFD